MLLSKNDIPQDEKQEKKWIGYTTDKNSNVFYHDGKNVHEKCADGTFKIISEKYGPIQYKFDSKGAPWFFSVDIIRALNYSVDENPLEELLAADEITDTGYIPLVAVYKMAYYRESIYFLRWLNTESGIIRIASTHRPFDAYTSEDDCRY
jgi:hypothetical protein